MCSSHLREDAALLLAPEVQMKPTLQDWDSQWTTPWTRIEQLAPVVAFALALALAWS